jgi:hypothetical protein
MKNYRILNSDSRKTLGGPATTGVPVLSGWPQATGGRDEILAFGHQRTASCALRAPGQQVVPATPEKIAASFAGENK